jgi:hypothetical protein
MKNKNKWMLGALLIGALASCEMKDELTGTTTSSQEMGALELDLSVLEPGSRAINLAEQFPVHITCPDDLDNPEKNKEFTSYSSMENPVQLPVGDYIVSANTAGDIFPIMTTPYYKGSEPLTISAGSTEQVEVVCKMANTKIKLDLPEDFETFQNWMITFDAGESKTLTFGTSGDMDGDGSSALYWYLGEEGAQTITMNITATTSEGVEVSQSETFSKSDVEESYEDDENNFVGGDALNIKIDVTDEPIDPNPDEPEETKPEISFGVTVDVTFNNTNESVTIPVTPGVSGGGESTGGETGGEGEEDAPITISDNGTGYLTNGVTVAGGKYPTDVAVVMNAKNGIQNVYVKIATTNSTFEDMVRDMHLVDGDGMDLASEGAAGLASFFPLPQTGATEYTFTMSETLFGLLANFAGKHDFMLTVIDAEGNQESATLTINL